jgi:hypothetical protein
MKRRENLVVLNDRDLITLNAYMDGALSPAERAAFEKRLAGDPSLQQEMDSLKATVALLHKVERMRVPRNFTLDPAKYGAPARQGLLDRLGFISLPQLVTAGGTLAAILICVGLVAYGLNGNMLGGSGPSVAMQPVQDEAADEAPQAEMQIEAATEEQNTFAAQEEPCNPEIAGTCPEDADIPPDTGSAAGGASGGAGDAAGTSPIMSPQPATVTATGPFVAEATSDDTTYDSQPADGDGQRSGEPGADDTEELNPKEPDVEGGADGNEATTFPLVPLALGGLVIVLAAGMFVARRARRRS